MIHPLVAQLNFTRSEWQRGLEGVNDTDAVKHLGPMNCISWLVGHMAWHEQWYLLDLAQGKRPYPELMTRYAYQSAKSSPRLAEILPIWLDVTHLTQPYLEKLTSANLQDDLLRHGKVVGQNLGTAIQRLIYHYWYHTGEVQAIRQLLGHHGLPEFVGEIEELAPYRSEYPC